MIIIPCVSVYFLRTVGFRREKGRNEHPQYLFFSDIPRFFPRGARRNALSRKGKADDTDEGDMDVVVSIHNNMNELTWKKILEWEKIRRCDVFVSTI